MKTTLMLTAFFMLFFGASPANAQSCNTAGVLGYPAEPSAACIEARGSLGPSAYAYTSTPPCDPGVAVIVGQKIRDYASTQAASAASEYGGPVAGVIAGLVGDSQAGQILGLLNVPSTTARCIALCVKVPKGRSVVEIRGMARDDQSHGGNPTYCQPGHPSHECAPGWSDLQDARRDNTPAGEIVCSIAANWSHDRYRDFALFVYYQ